MDWCDDVFTRQLRDEGTDRLLPQSSYADFVATAAKTKPVKEMAAIFETKLDSFAEMSPVLDAFVLVIEFEMNRPYEHWYPKQEPLDVIKANEIAEKLSASSSEKLRNLGTQLKNYVEATRGSVAATN